LNFSVLVWSYPGALRGKNITIFKEHNPKKIKGFFSVRSVKGNNVDSCDFSDSDVSSCHIQGSNLGNNIFKACSLKEAKFSGSNIDRCDFSGTNFSGTAFSGSNIYGCDFTGVDFTRVVIKSDGFSGVVVKSGDLEKNTISKAVWNRTSFIDTHIADIVFTGTLEDCYFENCSFTRVTFQNTTLIPVGAWIETKMT